MPPIVPFIICDDCDQLLTMACFWLLLPAALLTPHHLPQWLAAGGLTSLLQPNTPDIFVFDVSTPTKPVYKTGLTASGGACIDEFLALRSGGFYVSEMCSRTGEKPLIKWCLFMVAW